MTRRSQGVRRLATTGVLSAALCGCGISGELLSRTGQRMPELAGTRIYAVPATLANSTMLGDACKLQRDAFDRYRGEASRLGSTHRGDSLRSIAQPSGTAVDSTAVRLSVKAATIDSSGHFAFGHLSRGAYYLVLPDAGWSGVDGKQWPVHVTILIDDLQDACSAIGEG